MSPRAQLNSVKILDSAIELCDEIGYENLSLSALAFKLGIKSPSLYNHVKGLPELKQQLAITGLERLYEHLISSSIGLTGKEALLAISFAYVSFVVTHPGLYRSISSPPDPYHSEFDALSNKLVEFLIKLISPYSLSKDEVIHAVRGLRSILHGFSAIQLDDGFRLKFSQQESLNFIVTCYLTGLEGQKTS